MLEKNPKKFYSCDPSTYYEVRKVKICVCMCTSRQNDADLLIGGCRVALGTTKNTQKRREETSFLKNLHICRFFRVNAKRNMRACSIPFRLLFEEMFTSTICS